eukprot:156075-Hanusia_phi.AAC.1
MAFLRGSMATALCCSGPLPNDMYVVGDAAYKAIPNVLTPFEGSKLAVWHDSFNFHLSQLRINIEYAFGMLINRWGIFWRGLRTDNMYVTVKWNIARYFSQRQTAAFPASGPYHMASPTR